jgi:hypothetical protein
MSVAGGGLMWCPVCNAEYRDGFDRCAGCDVALVDAPVAERAERRSPYRELRQAWPDAVYYHGRWRATLYVAVLAAAAVTAEALVVLFFFRPVTAVLIAAPFIVFGYFAWARDLRRAQARRERGEPRWWIDPRSGRARRLRADASATNLDSDPSTPAP